MSVTPVERSELEFFVRLPQWSDRTDATSMQRIATAADSLGYDGLWRGDHIAFPVGTSETSGWSSTTTAFDPFAVFAHVAAITDRVRLGTNICVVPYRHPITLTKLALSIDALSEGRFELGVAPGWLELEFDALEIPFDERGSRTDEFLDLFERVQEEPIVDFDGPHHSFDSVGFYPRPMQDEIPVWIGGSTSASFRRVGRYGHGWTKTLTPDETAEFSERAAAAWRDFDRSGRPAIGASQDVYVGTDTDRQSPLVGTPDEIVDGIDAYRRAGATRIEVVLNWLPIDDRIEQLEHFSDEVLDRIR